MGNYNDIYYYIIIFNIRNHSFSGGEETTLIELRYPGENIEYDYNIDLF